jgi:hypothetical protein
MDAIKPIELTAKFVGIDEKKKLKNRKDAATGATVEDEEKIRVLTIKIKKIKLDMDGNIKPGTSDPWTSISIQSMDPSAFSNFKDMHMGDEVLIVITPIV